MTQDGKFHQDIKARGFSLSTCLADEILTSYDARKALQNALKSDIYTLNLPQKRVRKSISKLTVENHFLLYRFTNNIASSRIVLQNGTTNAYGFK